MITQTHSGIGRLLTWMAGIASLLIVVLPPAGYFVTGYAELAQSLDNDTRINGVVLSQFVGRNPGVWTFQSEPIKEILEQFRDHSRSIRVFDKQGQLLAELGDKPTWPVITRAGDFFEIGVAAGTVQATASLLLVFQLTALILVASGPVGFVVWVPLRQIPLRALERANAVLASRNHEYRTLVEGLVEGIILANETGVVVAANPSAGRILETPKGSPLVGESLEQLFASAVQANGNPFDPAVWFPGRGRAESFPMDRIELRIGNGGGQAVWLSARARPVVDSVTGRTEVVVSFEDITDRKRAEAELQALNASLEEKAVALIATNRELESFSYSMSHDLRTPLRSIMSFSQILFGNYHEQLDAAGRGYLKRVLAAAQRMSDLIDDLVRLAQVSRHELQIRGVDLSGLAQRVIDQLHSADPGRSVAVEIASGLRARCDRRMARVVLDNLLGNAWKFTAAAPAAHIEFGMHRQNGENVFFVSDNGAGFDPTYAAKLFVPFERLHGPGKFAGTGIGLATVRRIIERHGGRVWAEGQISRGATFYFSLPS